MFRRQLAGIQESKHLVEVAPRAHRISQHRLDLPVRSDDEHGSHRGVVRRCPALSRCANVFRQHVVGLRHLQLGVSDHGVVDGVTLGLLDVLGPLLVITDGIHAEADDLAVALLELRFESGHVAELGRADWRKVLRV